MSAGNSRTTSRVACTLGSPGAGVLLRGHGPLIVFGLVMFFPDPEYGGFFSLLATIEVGAIPEALLTTAVTTIIMAALPEKYRRPLW